MPPQITSKRQGVGHVSRVGPREEAERARGTFFHLPVFQKFSCANIGTFIIARVINGRNADAVYDSALSDR